MCMHLNSATFDECNTPCREPCSMQLACITALLGSSTVSDPIHPLSCAHRSCSLYAPAMTAPPFKPEAMLYPSPCTSLSLPLLIAQQIFRAVDAINDTVPSVCYPAACSLRTQQTIECAKCPHQALSPPWLATALPTHPHCLVVVAVMAA